MAVHWVGAPGACGDFQLDGNTCQTGTLVYPTASAKMVADIVEVYEYRVRRFLGHKVREGNRAVTSLELSEPSDRGMRAKLPWALPGPSASNPKGERTFRFPYVDQSGLSQWSPIIKSSGLGSFSLTETEKAPDVKVGGGVGVGGTVSVGAHTTVSPNGETVIEGVFKATTDPVVTVELLVPGNGLEEYLSEYLAWMASAAADQEALDEIVTDLISISSESDFEASIEPTRFEIDTFGWQDIALTINAGERATFFAALRFKSDTGDVYVTDLMSVSTNVEPVTLEQVGLLFWDVREWRRRWGTVLPSWYHFLPMWEQIQEPFGEGEVEPPLPA